MRHTPRNFSRVNVQLLFGDNWLIRAAICVPEYTDTDTTPNIRVVALDPARASRLRYALLLHTVFGPEFATKANIELLFDLRADVDTLADVINHVPFLRNKKGELVAIRTIPCLRGIHKDESGYVNRYSIKITSKRTKQHTSKALEILDSLRREELVIKNLVYTKANSKLPSRITLEVVNA